MTDEELALSILRKMAADPSDWTVEDPITSSETTYACLEATWFRITNEEAYLLRRLDTGGSY